MSANTSGSASAAVATGSTTIPPTVGRIIYGYIRKPNGESEGPFPCLVLGTKDIAGLTCVTVTKFDKAGSVTWDDVPLYDAGRGGEFRMIRWCEWMPFQQQAAKAA